MGEPSIAVATIYQSVIIEAFLWGLGTAIGELPPYFVARAASLAGNKAEELDELIDESKVNLEDKSQLPLIERMKVFIYKTLQKNAFICILVLASVTIFNLIRFSGTKPPFRSSWFPMWPLLGSIHNLLQCCFHWQSNYQSFHLSKCLT